MSLYKKLQPGYWWAHYIPHSHILKKLGCPKPNDPEYYSIRVSDNREWHSQTCFQVKSRMNKLGVKKGYKHIIHYTLGAPCQDEGTQVLCIREPCDIEKQIIVCIHPPLECPLCKYKDD